MPAHPKRSSILPNVFGSLGYLSVIMQWLWSTALLLPTLLANETIREFLTPQHTTPATSPVFVSADSVIMIVIAIVVTVVVLVITVVVLIRLPIALVRSSQKTIDSTVTAVIPVVTHHKKLTKKKRAIVTLRLRRYMKFGVCVLPLLPFAFMSLIEFSLNEGLALLVACVFAIISLIWFGLQYASAMILRVDEAKLI